MSSSTQTKVGIMAEVEGKLPPHIFVTWLIKTVLQSQWGTQKLYKSSVKHMKVIETLTIGSKKQLVLVSCGEERFLVGTGPESVQTIVRVAPAAAVSTAILRSETGAQS